ncbi:MAG: DUF2905 domain-containing protein [Chitinivibrionales bacterium]|nr:DUF2905 domain-containing protein [Chitinivibrionales bacterium]
MNMIETGRFLLIAGTILVVLGFVFLLADKIPLGRLWGDFRFGNDKVKIYFPLATCLIISLLITLIVNFFSRK